MDKTSWRLFIIGRKRGFYASQVASISIALVIKSTWHVVFSTTVEGGILVGRLDIGMFTQVFLDI